jgi:hypothetical protein
VLELQSWNPDQDEPLNLSGQWDFYWQSFLTCREGENRNSAPDVIAEVPGVWNNYKFKGENLPGFGYGTSCSR